LNDAGFVWKGFGCCWCGVVGSGTADGCDLPAGVDDTLSPLLKIGVGRWFLSRTRRKQKTKEKMKEGKRLEKKKNAGEKEVLRKRKKGRNGKVKA
jgi:hypothetical protein